MCEVPDILADPVFREDEVILAECADQAPATIPDGCQNIHDLDVEREGWLAV